MGTASLKRWHYATGHHFQKIIDDDCIIPGQTGVFADSSPFALFSSNRDWEPMATGRLVRPDGSRQEVSLEDASRLTGGLYRVGVSSSLPLLSWRDAKARRLVERDVMRRIEQTGRSLGALPNQWSFYFSPVEGADWTGLEYFDWIDRAWKAESLAGRAFKDNIRENLEAARVLLKKNLNDPCLILAYATIDTLAWLNIPDTTTPTKRTDFTAWVDTYLLPKPGINCTADELYGARCGLLHTRSSQSSVKGARQIMYAWKSRRREELQKLIDRHPTEKTVALHVETFLDAIEGAFEAFCGVLSGSPDHSRVVRRKARKMMPTAGASIDQSAAMISTGIIQP